MEHSGLKEITMHVVLNENQSKKFSQKSLSTSTIKEDKNADEFTGLYMECMSNCRAFIIISKLAARVVINAKKIDDLTRSDMSFCINVSTLSVHMKSIYPGSAVYMYRLPNDPELYVQSIPPIGSFRRIFTMTTLDKDADVYNFSDLTYNWAVHIDIKTLATTIKVANYLKSTHIKFSILEDKRPTKNGDKQSYFVISIGNRECTDEQVFRSISKENTLLVQNCAVDDTSKFKKVTYESVELKFVQYFAIGPIFNLLKSLSNQIMVLLRFNKDSPMTINFNMGDDSSFVSFVMSDARMPDDEEHTEFMNSKLKSFM